MWKMKFDIYVNVYFLDLFLKIEAVLGCLYVQYTAFSHNSPFLDWIVCPRLT